MSGPGNLRYTIDGAPVTLPFSGPVVTGGPGVLLREDDDLCRDCPWHAAGYTVATFLPEDTRHRLREGLTALVRRALALHGAPTPDDFTLARYHQFCGDDATHLATVRQLQAWSPIGNFPIDHRLIDRRISEILGVEVSCVAPAREAAGRFFLRIVRSRCARDNNPPHRDVWLDRLRHAINIYVPLAGSNAQSSLPLIAGSHLWPEGDLERTADGACVDGVPYTVPAVVASRHGMAMTRPAVADDEVLVFSPYLVHGGAVNRNADATRVSLEMRFWRAE